MSTIKFEVKGTSVSNTKLTTKVRNFSVDVDEPEGLGGKDEAPNPVEYVLIGLAGCINVVAHTIANEIGIVIEELKITTSGEININKFLGISDKERAGYKSIDIQLSFKSQASKSDLDRWLEAINKRCPVKDNLFTKTPVTILIQTN